MFPSHNVPVPDDAGTTSPPGEEATTIAYETVLYRRWGPVAEIRLNRPHVLNALNRQMDLDLIAAFAVAAADEEVRAILLSGEGRAFCAGADLKERAGSPPPRVEVIMEEVRQGLVFTRLWELDKPTLAAVQGYCLAGGYHLAAMCDIIVAAESARFGEPEIRFANPLLVPAAPFQLGHKRAREVLYSGDLIPAGQAQKLGLVSRVVPEAHLITTARRMALALAHLPPAAAQAQKRALRFADERRGFGTTLRANAEMLALTLSLQPYLVGEDAETFLRTARAEGLKTAIQRRDARLQNAGAPGRSWDRRGSAGEKSVEADRIELPEERASQTTEVGKVMETYRTLEYQQAGDGIVKITLNRPAVLNALNRELCRELDAALAHAASLPGVRAVILSGAGRAFSAGIDLKEPEEEPLSEARERRHLRSLVERCLALWDFPVPVIAAVHGYALGHACDLVLACDFAIAAEGTKLGVPEVRHGGGVAALFYPYTLGMRAARYLLLTGALIAAEQALQFGMINQVVPAQHVQAEAQRLAQRLALLPPGALRQMKRAINRAYEMMGLRDALEYNLETLILSQVAQPAAYWEEQQERIARDGLAAFLRQRDRPFEDLDGPVESSSS